MNLTGDLIIGGRQHHGRGRLFSSLNPATQTEIWSGAEASDDDLLAAVAAACQAQPAWEGTPWASRVEIASGFVTLVEEGRERLSELISEEVGKPLWESNTEVTSVIGKLEASLEAYEQRAAMRKRQIGSAASVTWFRPHGTVAVLGPFNFPAHMANGHLMPAILAGNAVVLKPSELAPAVGEYLVKLWGEAGLPDGLLNLVQGGARVGASLATHRGIAGVFFTGSRRAGVRISIATAATPEKLVVLEMGGNSPLVVWDYEDPRAAVLITLQSAYITAGQRCSAARRLIVNRGDATFIEALGQAIGEIRIGPHTERPEPYIGPLITPGHVDSLLEFQAALREGGGHSLVESRRLPSLGSGFVSPGLMDVTDVRERSDEEMLGPFLQLTRVDAFEEAIEEANRSTYGLAAGLVSRSVDRYEQFKRNVSAGCINWNQQLTGASGLAPFGGIKASGNHRPSGYFAVDYCSYAIGSMESPEAIVPVTLPPGLPL